MTNLELIKILEKLKATMISVSTGGSKIDEVNWDFQQQFDLAANELEVRGIANPLPYRDLWQWYGKWSSDLGSWASRRSYVADLFTPLLQAIQSVVSKTPEATGWARVDRSISEAANRLSGAATEEQFQAVGLICRETLISVAQEVYDPHRHPILDNVAVSSTDFKRMIEAYIAVEMAGSASEEVRRHARTALDLSLRLQHQRTAIFRDAAICVEATGSVVNIIAIVSGRRDKPSQA